jgi:hypothetical protein
VEEQLEFLDDFGLDVARASVLEAAGRLAEASEVHFSEGILAMSKLRSVLDY